LAGLRIDQRNYESDERECRLAERNGNERKIPQHCFPAPESNHGDRIDAHP
jgi:hypothetical protein